LGPADLAWFDRQRRAYFPPERNLLTAHLTMFHALPPSVEGEASRLLAQLARAPAPRATATGLLNLGRGVAYRIASEDLDLIREHVADRFHGSLSAQDAGGWRAHVTVQNKVAPKIARQTLTELERGFSPRPVAIAALELHRYLGGPWELVGRWPFRGRG
jgi:hypothetical protein